MFPVQRRRHCVEDALPYVTPLVFAPDHEANVLAFFRWFMALQNEAFVFRFDECQASRQTAEYGAHAPSDDAIECLGEQELPLVDRWVFRSRVNDVWAAAL